MSNLVKHAKRELELLGEDTETVEGLLKVVQAYADMGHSGGSHSVILPRLAALLNYENLTPLTDDPEEWVFHDEEKWPPDGIYQNIRNSKMLSPDRSEYWSVDEPNTIYIAEKSMTEVKTPTTEE